MSRKKRLLISMIESLGGLKVFQWLNRNKPQILMYHRIINLPNVHGLSPELFEKQLEFLAKNFRVVPIETLLDELSTGRLKPNTTALTFDDGHFDFYTNAWPLLKKYKLPATLYIATGFIDGSHWLWPDLIKYILLHSQVPSIKLEPLGLLATTPEHLERTWHTIGDYALTLNVDARDALIQQLAQLAGVSIPHLPEWPFSSVTWPQLQEMCAEGLDVGSHTISHPLLTKLDSATLTHELSDSAATIKTQLGRQPKGICYPNGRPEDINPETILKAQEAGYTYGLLGKNLVASSHHPFLIGRMATSKDLSYFKWSLSRRKPDSPHIPFHY